MNPIILEEAEKAGVKYLYSQGGALYSIKPAEHGFGFLYWSHLIPPIKPEHTLMLGYGGGTAAELMRKIWGPCKITGVDIQAQEWGYVEYKMKVMDAKEYVWDVTKDSFFKDNVPLFPRVKFDYVCIDLWNGGEVPQFVFDVEFVVRLREISTKFLCMNVKASDVERCRGYFDYGFKFERAVPIEGNSILWWSVAGK